MIRLDGWLGHTMRFRRPKTILSVLLLCINANVYAQSTGRVIGRGLDQTGAALPGVAIDLVVNARELTATTDDKGTYRFDAVPPGNAELTFRLVNFSVLRRSVSVPSSTAVTADVVLTLSLSADVIVTAAGTFRNVADVEDPASKPGRDRIFGQSGCRDGYAAGGTADHARR